MSRGDAEEAQEGAAYVPGSSADFVGGACESEAVAAAGEAAVKDACALHPTPTPHPAAGWGDDAGGEKVREAREASDVHALSASLRSWSRPALNGSFLPELVKLPDASTAVVLSSLQANRTITSLTLRDCNLAERSALAIGQLLAAGLPLTSLDLRDNAIGERGLIAIAAAMGSAIFELKLQSALPQPFSPPAVAALAGAASRCRGLVSVWLGEVDEAAGGSGGPLAQLQRQLLDNHEAAAVAALPTMAWGKIGAPAAPAAAEPSGSAASLAALPPSKLDEEGALGAAVRSLHEGKLRTLRLAHDAVAARASVPRHLELLRAMGACASLRVVQLVNVGLGDAWGRALASALPGLDSIRVLDVSHNLISSEPVRAIAAALPRNHSLLWLQLLPQWLPLERAAEIALTDALATRRLKIDLAVRAARGVLSARGDAGEPSVQFEWRGQLLSTQGTTHPSLNPRWEERFTLCVPGSLLWPPCRMPLELVIADGRRAALSSADPPMGKCELPLGALLLADAALAVRCTVQRDPAAAPVAARPAELMLELSTLHVGAAHPDDEQPGPPFSHSTSGAVAGSASSASTSQ